MFGVFKDLKEMFSRASVFPGLQSLDVILNTVETKDISPLGPRTICDLQAALMKGILMKADRNGHIIEDAKGYVAGFRIEHYGREIEALVKAAQLSTFSGTLHAWIEDRQKALAKRLAREHTYLSLRSLWDHVDENGRQAFLNYIVVTQNSVFSDDTLSFKPCTLSVRKMDGNMLARFQLGDGSAPVMNLDRDQLSQTGMNEALPSIIHEGIHSALRQLGLLYKAGRIPETHPLCKDAALMLDRIEANAYIPSMFGKAYYADVEENLCHAVHRNFFNLFYEQVDQRNHMRMSIGPRAG